MRDTMVLLGWIGDLILFLIYATLAIATAFAAVFPDRAITAFTSTDRTHRRIVLSFVALGMLWVALSVGFGVWASLLALATRRLLR